jgi:hypothetical protein
MIAVLITPYSILSLYIVPLIVCVLLIKLYNNIIPDKLFRMHGIALIFPLIPVLNAYASFIIMLVITGIVFVNSVGKWISK